MTLTEQLQALADAACSDRTEATLTDAWWSTEYALYTRITASDDMVQLATAPIGQWDDNYPPAPIDREPISGNESAKVAMRRLMARWELTRENVDEVHGIPGVYGNSEDELARKRQDARR